MDFWLVDLMIKALTNYKEQFYESAMTDPYTTHGQHIYIKPIDSDNYDEYNAE